MILFGFQHVLTMFPATVLCALIVGFHVSTVLTITGVATIAALLGSYFGIGKFIPLYYGSSFSYLAATVAITKAAFAQPAPDELIRIAQAGIVVTGLVNVVVGLIIKYAGGKETIDKVLPPIVTGSVACVIGIALGAAALNMASGAALTAASPDGSTSATSPTSLLAARQVGGSWPSSPWRSPSSSRSTCKARDS